MKSLRIVLLLAVAGAITVACGLAARQRPASDTPSSESVRSGFPKDVYPETGNRLPLADPSALDEVEKRISSQGSGYGPQKLRLHSPGLEPLAGGLNDYLRRQGGLEPRLVELSVLVAARELDSEYVWTQHEPAALKAGLASDVIDIVKYRKPIKAIGEQEASIIEIGREAIGRHNVSSETFAKALRLFGDRELLTIVSVMGNYSSVCIMLETFDQHLPPNDKPLLPMP